MACDDCTQARMAPAHARYDPRCLWCGARYARAVRTRPDLIFPAQVDGQEMGRRQWFEHVLATWEKAGHDPQQLRELAAGDAVPLEPKGGITG
jgi:hypothetical protein